MRSRSLIVLANILVLVAGCAATSAPQHQGVTQSAAWDQPAGTAAAAGASYLPAVPLNLYRLLPPPPEAGSAQERAELDEMLSIQAARTPEQVQRARADAAISIYRFADALGSPAAFNAKQLPLTTALFTRIAKDEAAFMDAAKDKFARPRPFRTEPRLSPVVTKPPSASYPSGHTTWAVAAGIILAAMVPERRAQIFARADEFAHNRIVGGVHYPSDVAAGHLAGTVFAEELFNSGRFDADEAAAAAELRQALGLPPLPQGQH